jgi:hypothetical protein
MFGSITQKQNLLTQFQQAGITYLEHESYQLPPSLGGHRLFVSPYAPMHLGGAFMPPGSLERKSKYMAKDRWKRCHPRTLTSHATFIVGYWNAIPDAIDILVTHTPPLGYLDQTRNGSHVGCPALAKRIQDIQPKVSIFGHIHESNGYEIDNEILYINACTSNFRYQPNQLPVVFDLWALLVYL